MNPEELRKQIESLREENKKDLNEVDSLMAKRQSFSELPAEEREARKDELQNMDSGIDNMLQKIENRNTEINRIDKLLSVLTNGSMNSRNIIGDIDNKSADANGEKELRASVDRWFKSGDDKEVSLETIFNFPTEDDYNNYKQKNNIKYAKRLENMCLDYIIDNEDNDFLNEYPALKIAKYIWNFDFISVRKILKNELKKFNNSKKDSKYYQLLLANSIVDTECNKIKKAKNNLKIILSKCKINYLNNIAKNILIMLGETKYLKNKINYDIKKPINLPNYDKDIREVLYNDFIKRYSGSVSLGVIDYKYYILNSTIIEWINVYIKFISLGLFNNINSHYEILLTEQVIQYCIYKNNNEIMAHIFFILLKSNISNNSLIDKTMLIIEDMISNKDIENIKIYLDLLIKNSIVSIVGIKFIIKYIYLI